MPTQASPDILLAFVAGLLSVLSPCVLPLMPAYLSLVSGFSLDELREGDRDAGLRRRVMRACLGFVSGFSIVFVLLGVGAVAVGRVVRAWRFALTNERRLGNSNPIEGRKASVNWPLRHYPMRSVEQARRRAQHDRNQEGFQFGRVGRALLLRWRSGYVPPRRDLVFLGHD